MIEKLEDLKTEKWLRSMNGPSVQVADRKVHGSLKALHRNACTFFARNQRFEVQLELKT